MGLTTALSNALSGLNVTQSSLDVTSQNIANAQTAGYSRKIQNNVMNASNGQTRGVSTGQVTRALDDVLQRSVRAETTNSGFINSKAEYLNRMDAIFGKPGSTDAIDTLFNTLNTSLQGLVTSPESDVARTKVVSEAQLLAQRLNSMSTDLNGLRSQTERSLTEAVGQANNLLGQIESINKQVISQFALGGMSYQNALDARDKAIADLSELVDLRVNNGEQGAISISTSNGTVLFDGTALKLNFDGRDSLTAQSRWSADSTKRDVGTISILNNNGTSYDLIAGKSIRGGKIAGLLELRDTAFVDAQAQFDELAAQLALSLSNTTTQGTAATSGAATGFDLNLSPLQSGNTFSVEVQNGAARSIYTFIKTTDATSAAAISFGPTTAGDRTVGIDFSGGLSSVVSQVQAALGSGYTVSNPSGSNLRILDDGAAATTNVLAASTSSTITSLQSGKAALPLFLDPGSVSGYFTGAPENGGQTVGFAQRISLNTTVLNDPSALVVFSSTSAAGQGDPTRPQAILDAIKNSSHTFNPKANIGSTSTPYQGTLGGYLQRIISLQSGKAESANSLQDSQSVVLNNLQARFEDSTGVDVDQEMASLTVLQQMYSANARVVSAISDMFDVLLRMAN